MSLGFEQAGFDVAAAVEYDPVHCATHEFNFPECAAICRSVADIDGKYIRDHSRIGDRPVDVLFGGAPCQGFSMIGKRALDDPRNSLVHHFVRLVVELKASYFVFENVRGLTIGAHRKFLEEIIAEFRKNGYRVLEDYRVERRASRRAAEPATPVPDGRAQRLRCRNIPKPPTKCTATPTPEACFADRRPPYGTHCATSPKPTITRNCCNGTG